MSRIADKLINNPEAAAEAGDGQSLHEPGTGEEQPLPGALAGVADQCLQESDRNAFDNQSSNFMDSDDIELLSWLEYPLDDFAFDQKHWPPPPPPFSTSPVPASPDFTCIPASSTLSAPSLPPSLSSSSASSSSISAVKHFPPLRDEAFMTGRDLDRRAVSAFEWSVQKEVETSEFWQEEQNNRMSGIQEAGAHDQGNMVDDKGALHSEWNRAIGERRAGIGTSILSRQAEPMLDELKPQFANVASNIKEPWLMKDVEMRLNGEVATIATPTEMRLNGEVAIATPTERLQARSHGNAALALGAGRAAGTIKPSGFEAFAKARTSLQPIQPCNPPLGSPSSFSLPLTGTQAGKSLYGLPALTSTVASRALGFSASLHVNDITELHDLAQLYAAKVFAEYFNNNDFQKNQSEDQTIMGKSLRICVASSHVQPSMIGPVSDTRVEQPKEGTSNASAVDGTFASASDVTDMRKLSGGSLVPQEEEVLVVSSGGSQTSGSLRETASGSKRKLEDLDYQSEEAEGESGLSSQARTSTSKSSRANEVHNLSEKMRRNRINEKMNALRHLIPNASKSNKAALLDEAIAYLKNLQLQLQVLSSRSGMNVPQMPLPTTMPHMQTVPCNSLHGMGMGNYMAAGSALAAAGGSSTVGSIHSSYAVPGRPYNTSQPLPIPMSAAGMTLQPALAFDSHHEAALPAAQAHHQLYFQPSHQVVSRVDPPTYNIYFTEEQQQRQRPQQQQREV